MKQSVMTGLGIYTNIRVIVEDLHDVNVAIDSVANLNSDYAVKILKNEQQKLEEKLKELRGEQWERNTEPLPYDKWEPKEIETYGEPTYKEVELKDETL